mgnify:CR=1 FL=1
MTSFYESAFHAVCKEAKTPESWYLCLMESARFYGGPEEGGWYGTDSLVVAYQEFPSEELANAALEAAEQLAIELTQSEQREYGEQCLRELDWLEARGLEADWLPEPDGPSSFSLIVSQGIPENSYADRHYS